MTLQVLIATMHQKDYSLLQKMNIQTDAIVVNQCERDEIIRFDYNGHSILWLSLNERGVGLSRNTALMRATADIVLFGDDDVVYVDGYADLIIDAYKEKKDAHIILFDLETIVKDHVPYRISSNHRVSLFNSLKYGAVHFTAKREALFQVGMSFNLLFGGGAKYSNGEDSLFLANAMQKGLRIWTNKACIGTVKQGDSTWFKGYNEKYFFDKGILMRTAFGWKAYILIIMLILKNQRQTKDIGLIKAIKIALGGVNQKIL